ncbi:putative reverse transcriptase zinc-binding domain-containing protein [Lupinus albus]|uniref:Putative reverse transcriptase zinc-binding domain-containing protein n=1 Tax=Lupinus albus TaxID=3870 RepID=A0A6A4NPC9_LUPAL|nr:putative reverse transcriptase zinc-binding domain-containing protein [Lupinus albus]
MICFFVWKVHLEEAWNLTKDKLSKRSAFSKPKDLKCVICKECVKSIDHLLISCKFAITVWKCF